MKNYLLVLLSIAGVGLLIDNINPTTPVSGATTSSEIVEIEEIPTLSKIEEVKTDPIQEITTTAKTTTVAASRVASSSTTSSGPNYRVTAYPSSVQSHNLTGSDIYKTNKLIYGHNSPTLLGNIRSLSIGATFSITENGVTNSYQVANSVIFQKTGERTLGLCTSGYDSCNGGTYYINTLQNATFRGKSYDVALFTCDGTNLGGGDATHRRVVFANKI